MFIHAHAFVGNIMETRAKWKRRVSFTNPEVEFISFVQIMNAFLETQHLPKELNQKIQQTFLLAHQQENGQYYYNNIYPRTLPLNVIDSNDHFPFLLYYEFMDGLLIE